MNNCSVLAFIPQIDAGGNTSPDEHSLTRCQRQKPILLERAVRTQQLCAMSATSGHSFSGGRVDSGSARGAKRSKPSFSMRANRSFSLLLTG